MGNKPAPKSPWSMGGMNHQTWGGPHGIVFAHMEHMGYGPTANISLIYH